MIVFTNRGKTFLVIVCAVFLLCSNEVLGKSRVPISVSSDLPFFKSPKKRCKLSNFINNYSFSSCCLHIHLQTGCGDSGKEKRMLCRHREVLVQQYRGLIFQGFAIAVVVRFSLKKLCCWWDFYFTLYLIFVLMVFFNDRLKWNVGSAVQVFNYS